MLNKPHNQLQVSWLKRPGPEDVPDLLTFGQTVYVKDARVSITNERRGHATGDEDWILNILHSKSSDVGLYECQISTEPPQIHKIYLSVEGKLNCTNNK